MKLVNTMLYLIKKYIPFCFLGIILFACEKDEDNPVSENPISQVVTPATYEFSRNGATSVSYSGQTDRLNQVAEMKSLLKTADNGNAISYNDLAAMFSNENNNGGGNFSFTSEKQLRNKTFELDIQWFDSLLFHAAKASQLGGTASTGTAGILSRSNGSSILVDENGKEFTQLFEKGIMGATFFNQVCNNYLTIDKIGDQVENSQLAEGKNYTDKEHHFDEAFGYFGAPVDFKSNYQGSGTPVFLAKYSAEMDPLTNCSDIIMNAFKTGRQAIVENNSVVLNKQVNIICSELEKLMASVAIHYVNETLDKANDGDRLHVLSECYGFTKALRYQNIEHRKLSQSEVDELLEKIGDNFWTISEQDLNFVKDKLSSTYGLEQVKDNL